MTRTRFVSSIFKSTPPDNARAAEEEFQVEGALRPKSCVRYMINGFSTITNAVAAIGVHCRQCAHHRGLVQLGVPHKKSINHKMQPQDECQCREVDIGRLPASRHVLDHLAGDRGTEGFSEGREWDGARHCEDEVLPSVPRNEGHCT